MALTTPPQSRCVATHDGMCVSRGTCASGRIHQPTRLVIVRKTIQLEPHQGPRGDPDSYDVWLCASTHDGLEWASICLGGHMRTT